MAELIASEACGDTHLIRIDDGKVNVMRPVLSDALGAALEAAGDHEVVIVGNSRAFCAGFDLAVIRGHDEAARAVMIRDAWRLWLRLYSHRRPVIVGLTGPALGFGAYLALGADRIVAEAGNYDIGFTEVALGVSMASAPFLLPITGRVPVPAREAVIAHSALYKPEDAVRVGLCDLVAPAGHLVERCLTEAAILGRLPEAAFAETKLFLRRDCHEAISAAVEEMR